MAWQGRTATEGEAAASLNVTVTLPTGDQAKDVLGVAVTWSSDPGVVVVPSGWETALAGNRIGLYYRIADGSELATYLWSWANSVASCQWLALAEYDDAGETPVFGAATVQGTTASGTSHATPSLNVPQPGSRLIGVWRLGGSSTNTWTAPGDMTLRIQGQQGATGVSSMAAVSVQEAAGASGAKTATSSATQAGNAALMSFHLPSAVQRIARLPMMGVG